MTEVNDDDDGAGRNGERWPPAHGLPGVERYKRPSTLKWGETLFDDLDRGELLRLVQAYHAGALKARDALMQHRAAQQKNPYWGPDGIGGRTLAALEYLIGRAGDGGANADSDAISRAFLRNAYGLLFPDIAGEEEQWGIDDRTGRMFAPFTPGDRSPLSPEQPLRALAWSDLLPKKAQGARIEEG
ncbi:hypothetical protein SAMN06295912_11266 [Sphingomonas laterariae]|uniref:Uncharacterized protein n=1 Tax=Edaphosphingomonas laterariae TaxID=861865 RepID=A0A239GGD3_9SPHN|nr:hypothetical protein SAMN06295912_11266 [Sphingomonas laterariae]